MKNVFVLPVFFFSFLDLGGLRAGKEDSCCRLDGPTLRLVALEAATPNLFCRIAGSRQDFRILF